MFEGCGLFVCLLGLGISLQNIAQPLNYIDVRLNFVRDSEKYLEL